LTLFHNISVSLQTQFYYFV